MEPKSIDRRRNDAASRPAFQFVQIIAPLQRRPADVERTVRAHVASRYHEQQRSHRGLSRLSEPGAPKLEGLAQASAPIAAEQQSSTPVCHIYNQSVHSPELLNHPSIGYPTVSTDSSVVQPKNHQHDNDSKGSQTGSRRGQFPLSPKTSRGGPVKRVRDMTSASISKYSAPSETFNSEEDIDGYFPMMDTRTIASPSYKNPFDVEAWATISNDSYQFVEKYIVQYYESSHLIKNPLRDTVIPAAMRFVGLFHSHLFYSLMSMAVFKGQTPGPTAFVHKGYVLQFINESLNDERRCCADEVIGSMISLINEACVLGNAEIAKLHLHGLHRMVALRGGIDRLGFNGDLKQIIIAHYYVFCILTSDLPCRFVYPTNDNTSKDNAGKAVKLADFRCFTLQEFFLGPEALDGITPEVLKLLDYIYRLANVYKLWNEVSLDTDSASYRKTLAAQWWSIRSSVLTLPSADSPIFHPAINDYVYESLRLAIIMLSRKGISAMDPKHKATNSSRFFEDAKSLHMALEKTRLLEFWEPLPGAAMWCLAIGANLCEKGTLKSWFLAHVLRIINTYRLFRKTELDESVVMILHGLRPLQIP